jgi:uncharacterized membrane protein
MGSLNFRTNDQSKASRSSADLDQAFAVEQVEKKLSAAKIRLVLENQTLYKLFIFLGWNWKFLPGWKMFHSS